MISTLDHIIVAVRDLEAATLSYERLLGRTPSWRGRHEGYGTANSLFRLNNTYLELLAPVGKGDISVRLEARLDEQGPGLAGLAFGTDDIEASVRTLRMRGVSVADPRPGEGCDETTGAVRRWRNAMVAGEDSRAVFMFLIEHETPDSLPPAPVDEEIFPEAAVSALDLVVVRTGAPEAAQKFYGPDGLGLRLALKRDEPQWGGVMLFFRVGGATVEVVGKRDDSKTHDELWGLAWQVQDVAAAQARLGAAGFDMSSVRAGRKPGTRVCTVRGAPEGVPTLIIGPGDAPPPAQAGR